MANKFTHLDASDNPSMVDVSDKKVTARVAHARSIVVVSEEVLTFFEGKDIRTIPLQGYTSALNYSGYNRNIL